MNVQIEQGVITVTLSRRNLLALLAKLDEPDSMRTILRDCGDLRLVLRAEDDAVHYADREPGPMTPTTEAGIRRRRQAMRHAESRGEGNL